METNRGVVLAGGTGAGAALMFLLDPARGRRRRALLRDRMVATLHGISGAGDVTRRDAENRARGLALTARTLLTRDAVDDTVLVERVRACMGRVVSHPHAIEVQAREGRVTLKGPILAHEADRLLRCVSRVRGVRGVENRLDERHSAGASPELQGGMPRRGDQFELWQTHWSPTARLLVGMAGSMLATYGARRRDVAGAAIGTAGLGLLARACTDMELKRLVGIGAGRRAVDIQKVISVRAPVEQVYAFWSRYESFPRFMQHVRAVRKTSDDQSHWIIVGPAGTPITFDAVVTRRLPNEMLAWKTLPGSAIQHSGMVRFQPTASGGTCLDIKMSYNPLVGGLGHSLATLLGADLKHLLDDDLVRLKSLIEEGKTRVHGEAVAREEVAAVPDTRATEPVPAGLTLAL